LLLAASTSNYHGNFQDGFGNFTTSIATNGFASYNSNLVAPVTVTGIGASPFSYTNTATYNLQVFIDANGGTLTVSMNGTQTFSGASQDHSIMLQPNEYVTLSWTGSAPSAKTHPF